MIGYLIILLLFAVEPLSAHAYLDPGTGSFIIQVVIAAVAGISFSLKIYWKKMAGQLSRVFKREKKDGE